MVKLPQKWIFIKTFFEMDILITRTEFGATKFQSAIRGNYFFTKKQVDPVDPLLLLPDTSEITFDCISRLICVHVHKTSSGSLIVFTNYHDYS